VKNKAQIGRFAIVGTANTIIDFGLLFLLTFLGLPKLAANTVSTGTAFVFSFFANKKYTFKSTSKNIKYEIINDLHLLTAKPIIYTFNVDEAGLGDHALQEKLAKLVAPARGLFICAKLEEELRELSNNDALELLDSYGASETGLSQLIHAAYDTLGLQSYLTAGQKEVRAWTIHKGWTAPRAAGVIHSDFERGLAAGYCGDGDCADFAVDCETACPRAVDLGVGEPTDGGSDGAADG